MDLAASRRIRAHFSATPQFKAACSAVYKDVLSPRASAGVGPDALHAAVLRLHEVLCRLIRRYHRLAPFTPDRERVVRAFHARLEGRRRLAPDWEGFDRVLRSVVRIRASDLTEEIALSEAEFEELALDVIVEEVLWYLKWDGVRRIFVGAVAIGAAAVANQGEYGYLAVLFAVYCLSMAALHVLALRFRVIFFLL